MQLSRKALERINDVLQKGDNSQPGMARLMGISVGSLRKQLNTARKNGWIPPVARGRKKATPTYFVENMKNALKNEVRPLTIDYDWPQHRKDSKNVVSNIRSNARTDSSVLRKRDV